MDIDQAQQTTLELTPVQHPPRFSLRGLQHPPTYDRVFTKCEDSQSWCGVSGYKEAREAIQQLYAITEHAKHLEKETVQLILRSVNSHRHQEKLAKSEKAQPIKTSFKTIQARTPTQHHYLSAIENTMLTLGLVLPVLVNIFSRGMP